MIIKDSKTVALLLHPAIEHALNVIDLTWFEVTGRHARITGLGEEGHSDGSLHYGVRGDVRCRAVDVDASEDQCTAEQRRRIHELLRERLGGWFDLVWEGLLTAAAHLHVEWQPKVAAA